MFKRLQTWEVNFTEDVRTWVNGNTNSIARKVFRTPNVSSNGICILKRLTSWKNKQITRYSNCFIWKEQWSVYNYDHTFKIDRNVKLNDIIG